MSTFERQYADLVKEVLLYGPPRETRNATTLSIFGRSLTFDLCQGFPILEGRRIFTKGVFGELAAMLRQPKHIKDFEAWGCNYWKQWANEDGSISVDYGNAWFDFEGFNQIADLKDKLANDPTNRRMIINSWRPHRLSELNLPCCHYAYQFYVDNDDTLHMIWTQRSADLMIGVPSDAVFAAAWLIAIANEFNLEPGTCKMDFGDVHIYHDHIEPAKRYLNNVNALAGVLPPGYVYHEPKGKDFCQFNPFRLEIIGYNPKETIKFNLHS